MLIYMKAFFMSHDVIESSGSGGKLGMSTAACFLLPGPPTTFTSWPWSSGPSGRRSWRSTCPYLTQVRYPCPCYGSNNWGRWGWLWQLLRWAHTVYILEILTVATLSSLVKLLRRQRHPPCKVIIYDINILDSPLRSRSKSMPRIYLLKIRKSNFKIVEKLSL